MTGYERKAEKAEFLGRRLMSMILLMSILVGQAEKTASERHGDVGDMAADAKSDLRSSILVNMSSEVTHSHRIVLCYFEQASPLCLRLASH